MYFSLNYDSGYVITCTKIWDDGILHSKPLRKFHEQGDALCFKNYDCPKLNELQIKTLARKYDPTVEFKRLNKRGGRFIDWNKWAQAFYNYSENFE